MYRGRPPPKGGYGQPLEGRGLPPPRPYPVPAYRDDRNRPRPPFHPGFHEQGHSDSYHRSPPRRRYPSPGLGHRGGEYWAGRPPRERSPSPRGPGPIDHNLVITVGNELTGPSGSAASRHHDREYPPQPEYERSRGRSPDRSRAKSQGRSKSRGRSPDRSRDKSRGRSPDRSRDKSRGRSPDRSRDKSRGRSKSRSPGRSRSRPRSRSRGRSQGRSKSRQRSLSASSSSSSSSSSGDNKDVKTGKEFKELETARRRKELEEMLTLPTKSILKKRTDSEDSPSLKNNDSPRGPEGSNISRVADQLLLAVKGMEPHMVASMLSELRSDPQMAHRAGLDAEIKEILHLLGSAEGKAQEKVDDIDDEEKFLYGDSEEPKPLLVPEPVRHHGLDLYGEVTEEALYGDPQKHVLAQNYGLLPAASSHLQAPPTEVEVRYASRPAIIPDQNTTVQVLNSSLPGMEPMEEGERQALEEYEKIQDLLKTIGLDLGVTEISKMAARTKERLHGNKPAPKTPTRSRRYSSASSDGSRGCGRRSHSSSSTSGSSRSRSRSCGRGGSWSSRKSSAPHKSHQDCKQSTSGQSAALPPPPTPDHNILPGVSIPPYPPSQVHGLMPPNFPPPGYSQYGNYLPYMHQQWPPMYPPPTMAVPPQVGLDEFPPAPPYKQPYGILAPEPGAKAGSGPMKTSEPEKGNVSRVSEEQNNESQKQKVLEEREKLKQERDVRMKKKEYLMKELERLRKQQGELLRKKRREKGGHKDPLLQEISHLQEEVMAQISNLRKEHEAAEKNRNEIEKIALILGLIPSDRPRRTAKLPVEPPPPEKKKCEAQRSPEGQRAASSSTTKTSAPASGVSPDELSGDAPPPPEPFEYYDAGNHWCKSCNVTSGSMFDYFTHLHSKTHRKTLDPYDRPWASTPTKIIKNLKSEEKLTKPAKGSEFLQPVRGFFCLLCKQFYGDAICAEEHVTTHAHNDKYKKQMYENPLYEQRRNLDRQAGLGSETSGKKRKHEDEDKRNRDEKSKHKKEKREKKKDEEPNVAQEEKIKKEEEEAKPCKRAEELQKAKSLEVVRPLPEEKFKGSRKEERHRSSREEEGEEEEEEERGKHSRKEDLDRCKHREEEGQRRYRREEKDRYDSRPKHAPHSDFRSKPQPLDPPKVLCGPSPAMRAKLRKQSLETGRPPPAAAPSFGKFTWKRKESVLAKEAEKVAAEFIKEDEAAAGRNPVSAEDSFARSMAVAKEIADKLGGHTTTPPWVYNRGRIRPNLPAPAAVLRKTNLAGKPAPLNTFLSIQNAGLPGPPSFSDGLIRALNARSALLENKPRPLAGPPGISEATPPPPASRPAPSEARPAPAVCKPAPPKPPPPVCNPAPPVSKPAPIETKFALPETTPVAKPAPPSMMEIVSDVAAPGVPEGEQTRMVFVKPPPFMNMGDGPQKPEKLRSNLAAAKAQDLFNIFYSKVDQSAASSITKPAADASAAASSTNKSCFPATQPPKPQPALLTPAQPPSEVRRTPPPGSQSPQTQQEPVIQIESVWSLQPPPDPRTETQPGLGPPVQSKDQSGPQNQISTPTSQSQTKPAEMEPTPQTQCPQIPTDTQPDQNTQSPLHLETCPDTAPEHAPKPSPRTRGKATPTKRTPPAPCPVRQTRSQTRYQTRQQSQSEPEPALGDSDSVHLEPNGPDSTDPGAGLLLEEGTPSGEDTPLMEITSETLGLPADMTSLNFDYDFNFE
nr:zinc finger protein 318 [Gasterosteus aculeatus aculeatus]